jgi:hypothetical protein
MIVNVLPGYQAPANLLYGKNASTCFHLFTEPYTHFTKLKCALHNYLNKYI